MACWRSSRPRSSPSTAPSRSPRSLGRGRARPARPARARHPPLSRNRPAPTSSVAWIAPPRPPPTTRRSPRASMPPSADSAIRRRAALVQPIRRTGPARRAALWLNSGAGVCPPREPRPVRRRCARNATLNGCSPGPHPGGVGLGAQDGDRPVGNPSLRPTRTGFTRALGCRDRVAARLSLPGARSARAWAQRGVTPPPDWRPFGEDVAAAGRLLGLRGAVGIGHSVGGHAVALRRRSPPRSSTSLLLDRPDDFSRGSAIAGRARGNISSRGAGRAGTRRRR